MNLLCPIACIVVTFAAPIVAHCQAAPAASDAQPSARSSGIDHSAADPAVRVQDDAFLAVNGGWLAGTVIPADRNSTGAFDRLYDQTQIHLRELIEAAAKDPAVASTDAAARADTQKIAALYAGMLDEARADAAGLAPLAPLLARVDAIANRADLAAALGAFDVIGVDLPIAAAVHQDAKDATRYIVDLGQGGIGLPDRDYFLLAQDKRFADIRVKYQAYIAQMLALAGDAGAAAKARAVFDLEAAIARAQWDRVANRDPVKTYNPTRLADLAKLAPHFDWQAWLAATGIAGKADSVVVSQPSYLKRLDASLATVPLATWKLYLRMRLLQAHAPFLSKPFVDAHFAFNGTVLHGTPEIRPRWKRAVALVQASVGEGLGRLYVARYFPPASKARMDALVANLLAAYRQGIDSLDWMSPETRREAQAKLATFMPKIGYPSKWRDYAALQIAPDDLVGNVQRARAFEYRRNLAKLGQPVDRDEWGMTPQTINAYYNPELNEIVFPAAILQPPFFHADADDAVNYGAIGAVIGHEISHGFDDQGSQYDGLGNLRNWWNAADRQRFQAKTRALIAQYGAYEVVGYKVNGALTLGENIADNAGLAIAARAYQLSLGGRPAPVIDGLTGMQRLYMGFAQIWQEKVREASMVAQLKSDPHSPGHFRANGALVNQDGFQGAFNLKPGDRMYLAPDRRTRIW